jgi:hypothetical protein
MIQQYTVERVTPDGHKHLRDALIDVPHPGSPIRRRTVTELLAMVAVGAEFWAEVPADDGGCPDILSMTVSTCPCGRG